MKLRIGALSALCVFLLACPPGGDKRDGGDTADGAIPTGSCTELCADNETCNTTTRSCVSRCGGGAGCAEGICAKVADAQYACRPSVTQCNGVTCGPGQNTCIAGKCSCTPALRGSPDTCAEDGKICAQQYNPVTQSGGDCKPPVLYQECKTTNCPSGSCAPCPAGQACESVFAGGRAVCLHTCTADSACNADEFCYSKAKFDGDDRCYPPGLFGRNCQAQNPDGGTKNIDVPVANPCKPWTDFPNVENTNTNTSSCTYAFFSLSAQQIVTNVCRPPGTVGLYGACKADFARPSTATQCAVGLECVLTRADTGICLKACNAAPPALGFIPQPACAASEACVNLYRQEDPNSVLGVCLTGCSVFASGANNGCGSYVNGATSTPASCVPVPPDGRGLVTLDGAGLCIPQKATVATAGGDCVETDAFRGAACASGQLCTSPDTVAATPKCAQPCDLGCVDKTDGGTLPARCATEANARCGAGSCARLTSTTGVTLGFCQ